MFDFNKVSVTLDKLLGFLAEQKKERELAMVVQTAAIMSINEQDSRLYKDICLDALVLIKAAKEVL